MRRQIAKQPSRSVKYGRVLADMAYRWPCFSVADFPVGRALANHRYIRAVLSRLPALSFCIRSSRKYWTGVESTSEWLDVLRVVRYGGCGIRQYALRSFVERKLTCVCT